jgi:hypothetical protein
LSLDEKTKNIAVNCFNPGLIVSTGLFRDQNPLFTKVWNQTLPFLDLLVVSFVAQ